MKPRQHRGGMRPDRPRLLAGWQRVSMWLAWLACFALCVAHADSGSLSLNEIAALCAAGTFTFWCLSKPLGKKRVDIIEIASVQGEFQSQTNWGLVVLSTACTLVGTAAAFKIAHDLRHGLTTVWGVFADFIHFFLEYFLEQITRGIDGEVTETRLYILVVLLPIGGLMLWINLIPWIYRGYPFRVAEDGTISAWRGGRWQPVPLQRFGRVTADGISIEFHDPQPGQSACAFPLGRVFSRTHHTRVSDVVLAAFFRARLEKAGFELASGTTPTATRWEFIRREFTRPTPAARD